MSRRQSAGIGSCSSHQKPFFTWFRLARSSRDIYKSDAVARDDYPTEADGFGVVPVHAGRVRIRSSAVARVKPIERGGINRTCPSHAPGELVQAEPAHAFRIIGT